MRTRPYRNGRIITALQELYFTGGALSFATRFDRLFIRQDGNSPVTRQVPLAMVSLVATAVSYIFHVITNSMLSWVYFQLYAALFEWKTGERVPVDFCATAFLDVYTGHVNSLKHILDGKPDAYHHMMGTLYSLARCVRRSTCAVLC